MLNNNIFINYMENIIDQLEEKFLEIRNVFIENENLCLEISTKVNKIKEMYLDFMGDNDKQILIFGLDTLHFQYKFFNKELLHINEYKVLLSNRIYCEYFKLYKLIQEYCVVTNKEEKCEETNNLKISVETGEGYRALTNLSNHGGQEVPHLHFHLFGGEKIGKMVQ